MQFVQKIMAAQSALPELFFGADALSETGLENWMRLTIYIDKNGQIISANKLRMPARNYPVCIEKQNRKLRIFISKKITTDALLRAYQSHPHFKRQLYGASFRIARSGLRYI